MLATLGALPPTTVDDQWAYEIKWDGMRAIAHVVAGEVRLRSRNDNDVTVSFPELARLDVPDVVLDGEIVCFRTDHQPDFGRLQRRMHVAKAADAAALAVSDPVVFLAFDLPLVEGTYVQRRAVLESMSIEAPGWQVPPHFVGGGATALGTSQQLGLEGIIAKKLTSRYVPGRRSPEWLKIKNVRTQAVVIGGWKPGAGSREGTIGSLLLGLPSVEGLTYVGKVGTGFTQRSLATLREQLEGLVRRTSPFLAVPALEARDAVWLEPLHVGEVTFGEWTGDGRLRHPVWRGLRPDTRPDQVTVE
jgi:bifunctional non-homologous end joining protein LigD